MSFCCFNSTEIYVSQESHLSVAIGREHLQALAAIIILCVVVIRIFNGNQEFLHLNFIAQGYIYIRVGIVPFGVFFYIDNASVLLTSKV